jgi:membrane protease YdiL (CAAX protease family)
MLADSPNPRVAQEGRRPARPLARTAAIAEVLLAFAVVHVAFRAIKQFTAWGRFEGEANLNFTPGVVMILFTLAILAASHRDFATYGLTLARWQDGLKTGLLWGIIIVAGAGLLAIAGVRHQPGRTPPTLMEGVIYGIAALTAVVLFARLLKRQRALLDRVPVTLCLLLPLGLLFTPLVVALIFNRSLTLTLLSCLWLTFGAGFGEEIFYRGYIQSRINETFGRPYHVLQIQFGIGLLTSSLLFGCLHTLNSVDYFHHRFTFAWGFGLANVATGLLYGILRETTGSVLAGAVTHAILDVLVIIPGLISGA